MKYNSYLLLEFQEIPFLVEDKIKELGGYFEKAGKLWDVSAPRRS